MYWGAIGSGIVVGRAPGRARAGGLSRNVNAVFPQGLDGVIGLHPQLQPLYESVWANGQMAVLPASGQTVFDGLAPGTYTVLAMKDAFYPATGAVIGEVTLASAEDVETALAAASMPR